uniref:Predicted protein putative n=1 Tax=Albugo laibachii Nc14 TaxID=890382 RepID=F0WBY2_9STRA|nr:predicted protein putative [Albugo laibachii Nc14]|eukprot:CCA18663.1 predicted protein putative [Albugo laibachii Nc14]
MTESKDTDKVFRKTQWNKVCWDSVLIGAERADSYYMRSGLIRKDLILRFASDLIPASKVITNLSDLEMALRTFSLNSGSLEPTHWVLKRPSSSNGVGLFFFSSIKATDQLSDMIVPRSMVFSLFEELKDTEKPLPTRHILQTYVIPLMHPAWGDRKYHFRALVLAVGDLEVYLYDDIRVLSATDPIDMKFGDNWADPLRHITNQSVNEVGKRYCQNLQNRSLFDFIDALRGWSENEVNWPEAVSPAPHAFESYIRNGIREMTATLFDRIRHQRRYFLALSNCFELFGLDFMVSHLSLCKYRADLFPSR